MAAITSFCLDSTSLKCQITHWINTFEFCNVPVHRESAWAGWSPVVGASPLSEENCWPTRAACGDQTYSFYPQAALVGHLKPQTIGSVPANLPAHPVHRDVAELESVDSGCHPAF